VPERSLADAYTLLAAEVVPVAQTESLPVREARGRVLAQTLVCPLDLPGADLAAMDGYAVRSADIAPGPNRLRVMGRVLAGQVPAGMVGQGDCVRIMTGAPMPPGSDAVVVVEAVVADGAEHVRVPGPVVAGANRRRRGEHVHAGEVVMTPGRRLGVADIALASAMGLSRVDVFRRLHVGVLSTGDELRDPPAPLTEGGGYDSNRPMLLAALAAAAITSSDLGICPDDPAALERIVARALHDELDVLLISGGAAQGDADVVRGLDRVRFVDIAVRPGRGLAVAHMARGGRRLLVLGLPGNAVAAYVLMYALALPLLRRLGGAAVQPPQPLLLPIARDLHGRPGRIELRRARLLGDAAGRRLVDPLPEQGSAMIRSVADADALVAVGPAPEYRSGELLPVYPIETFEGAH
jgi:molybdopterin molybdotransferase